MEADESPTRDLPRGVLLVLFILGLTFGVAWILQPFLTTIIGAATITISTWPMLLGLQRRLRGSRGFAIAVMISLLALAILTPLYFGVVAAVQGLGTLAAWMRDLPDKTLPPLPDWLANAPVVGAGLEARWAEISAEGGTGLKARIAEHATPVLTWIGGRLGNMVGMLGGVFVTLGLTGFLYARGEKVAEALLVFARRLGGTSGEHAARMAAMATRGVGLGVVLTPIIQSILAGIGMAIAGAPFIGLFSLAVLVSCLAQAGPIPAMMLAVLWLCALNQLVPAAALLVWAFLVHLSGPVIRPVLIRRGVDLPLALILSGVIGGVAAFGAIGLFIGPVVLAVAASLLQSWLAEGREPQANETARASSPGRPSSA